MRMVQLVQSIRDFDWRHDTGFFNYGVWPSGITKVISRSTERGEYRVWGCQVCKRTLLADIDSAVSEPNISSWNENSLPCMHSFWKFPRKLCACARHCWNSIGSWKVAGVLRIIKYNARHRLKLLHHRWSVDAYFLYFVIGFHTCARLMTSYISKSFPFLKWNYRRKRQVYRIPHRTRIIIDLI